MATLSCEICPLGDTGILVRMPGSDPGERRRARALAAALESDPPRGTIEVVAAFASVAVYYNPELRNYDELRAELAGRINGLSAMRPPAGRIVEIPVCYGGECGPDLAEVAARAGLSAEEAAWRHAAAEYTVGAIGFSPGFPYLEGLPEELAAPRRAMPRTRVPAGSVGIAGRQTCIYPFATPGGWRLIGRTPLILFDPDRMPPSLLRPGDRVRFVAIDEARFRSWKRVGP